MKDVLPEYVDISREHGSCCVAIWRRCHMNLRIQVALDQAKTTFRVEC